MHWKRSKLWIHIYNQRLWHHKPDMEFYTGQDISKTVYKGVKRKLSSHITQHTSRCFLVCVHQSVCLQYIASDATRYYYLSHHALLTTSGLRAQVLSLMHVCVGEWGWGASWDHLCTVRTKPIYSNTVWVTLTHKKTV